jgi:phosphoenolpyruvate-protein kinase (PTS system EI component)
MTPERTLRGTPAAPGIAAGRVLRLAARSVSAAAPAAEELPRAERALAAAGAGLERVAARLRAGGDSDGAEIVAANAQLCADPALLAAAAARIAAGDAAAAAIEAATASFAGSLEALPDPNLAARAADVRSIGRRAVAALDSGVAAAAAGAARRRGDPAPAPGAILVAADLGPADVVELDGVAGIALAAGSPGAHAAILARSLGIPMVVGLGEEVLAQAAGALLALDGGAGTATLEPTAARLQAALAPARESVAVADGRPAATADGARLPVLVNAAGVAEARAGVRAGAEGIGLLRTEVAFLATGGWPTVDQHRAALRPVLAELAAGATCTVRTLDFGADKTPPFLAGSDGRGVALQLAAAGALEAQLQAFERERDGLALRVLLPVAESAAQIAAARALLADGTALGAMLETAAAVAAAPELLAGCDFASIGTNDLAHDLLGIERGGERLAPAHHPRVLAAIATVAAAAAAAGLTLEVCGEAASDRTALPLLVGLGIGELSVGAALVAPVRAWLRSADRERLAALAQRALRCESPAAVAALVAAELGVESGDQGAELLDRLGGVGAVGPQGEG